MRRHVADEFDREFLPAPPGACSVCRESGADYSIEIDGHNEVGLNYCRGCVIAIGRIALDDNLTVLLVDKGLPISNIDHPVLNEMLFGEV